MTEAQVEAVARAYCRRMGLDPDEKGGECPWTGQLVISLKPNWETYSLAARHHIAMREALDEVLK